MSTLTRLLDLLEGGELDDWRKSIVQLIINRVKQTGNMTAEDCDMLEHLIEEDS